MEILAYYLHPISSGANILPSGCRLGHKRSHLFWYGDRLYDPSKVFRLYSFFTSIIKIRFQIMKKSELNCGGKSIS